MGSHADSNRSALADQISRIEHPDQQGIGLTKSDYLWLVVVTGLVPALLIAVGAIW